MNRVEKAMKLLGPLDEVDMVAVLYISFKLCHPDLQEAIQEQGMRHFIAEASKSSNPIWKHTA